MLDLHMPEFTAHNIRLDNGTYTMPERKGIICLADHPLCNSFKRLLNAIFPGDKSQYRIVDLGCLEGGYSVEFARMGFNVVGIEVRMSNIKSCHYVKENVDLPNLKFIQDDVWNLENYGSFDAIFCCGLLYHLHFPFKFLQKLSSLTKKLLILHTHFAPDNDNLKFTKGEYGLMDLSTHEGLNGRWAPELTREEDFNNREEFKWAAWGNKASFWITRSNLLHALYDVGFKTVMEQFDGFSSNIAKAVESGDGYIKRHSRGTFIGIKP